MQLPVLCRRASLSLPPSQLLIPSNVFYKITAWIVYRHDNPVITANVTWAVWPPPASLPSPAVRSIPGASRPCHGVLLRISCGMALERIPWVPEVFLAPGGNFRCWSKAKATSGEARVTIMTWQKPETALGKSPTPRVLKELIKFAISHLCNPSIYNY